MDGSVGVDQARELAVVREVVEHVEGGRRVQLEGPDPCGNEALFDGIALDELQVHVLPPGNDPFRQLFLVPAVVALALGMLPPLGGLLYALGHVLVVIRVH